MGWMDTLYSMKQTLTTARKLEALSPTLLIPGHCISAHLIPPLHDRVVLPPIRLR